MKKIFLLVVLLSPLPTFMSSMYAIGEKESEQEKGSSQDSDISDDSSDDDENPPVSLLKHASGLIIRLSNHPKSNHGKMSITAFPALNIHTKADDDTVRIEQYPPFIYLGKPIVVEPPEQTPMPVIQKPVQEEKPNKPANRSVFICAGAIIASIYAGTLYKYGNAMRTTAIYYWRGLCKKTKGTKRYAKLKQRITPTPPLTRAQTPQTTNTTTDYSNHNMGNSSNNKALFPNPIPSTAMHKNDFQQPTCAPLPYLQ